MNKIIDIPMILSPEEWAVLITSMSEQEIRQLGFNAMANAVFNKFYELKKLNPPVKNESEAS